MIAIADSARPKQAHWQAGFLALLPDIERNGRFAFRHLRREDRQEAVTEAVANAACAYRRLVELGKSDLAFASVLSRFAVAQFRAGRRVGSAMNSQDVLGAGRQRPGVRVVRLDDAAANGNGWSEGLVDNMRSPIPDQGAFRIDFPVWLDRQSRRDRKLAEFLVVGNSTSEAAQRFGISCGRVSQLRAKLHASWESFCASEQSRATSSV